MVINIGQNRTRESGDNDNQEKSNEKRTFVVL